MRLSVSLGATAQEGSECQFLVWAPLAERVDAHIVAPREQVLPLTKEDKGYFRGICGQVGAGTCYFYTIDGRKDRPDPTSRFQPQGVHGPSQVIDSRFAWEDHSWSGMHLSDFIIYEIHTGAFTPQGIFDAVIPCLNRRFCSVGQHEADF